MKIDMVDITILEILIFFLYSYNLIRNFMILYLPTNDVYAGVTARTIDVSIIIS